MFRFKEEFANEVSEEFMEKTKELFATLQSKGATSYYDYLTTFDSGIVMPANISVECEEDVFYETFELYKLMFELSGLEDEDYAPCISQFPIGTVRKHGDEFSAIY